MLPRGIEPRSSVLQTGAMTTSAKAANWSPYKDLNLDPTAPNGKCNQITLYGDKTLVPQEGIEPPHPDYKTGPLPLRIQGQKTY